MTEIIKLYLVELLELVKSNGSFIIGKLPAISREIILWGVLSGVVSMPDAEMVTTFGKRMRSKLTL